MDKLHKQPYLGHPIYQKMITLTRKYLFWPNMKKEVAEYLTHCIECQHIKDEHQHLAGLLQPLPNLERKWEVIRMDFITGLRENVEQHELIMAIVDKLSKEAHFIPVKYAYKNVNIVNIFMKEILWLHGVPKVVISYRDVK